MYMCQAKSKLMHIFHCVPKPPPINNVTGTLYQQRPFNIAIIDAMVEIYALNKPETVNTCQDLAEHFIMRLQRKYWMYDKVHLAFDMYAEKAMKNSTRKKTLHGITTVQYKIIDSTNFSNVTMED